VSGPLAIATVTAVMKDLLNDGLVNSDLSAVVGSFRVSALPPDRIATGEQEANQLNLFLYQVTANPGWRNADLPSRSSDGAALTAPPLALDLHYLVTAYGATDLDAEVLLGYAMHLLHETPALTRDMIRRTFSVTSPVTDKLLPESITSRTPADLADQVEVCKIAPRYLTTEELSRLWSAMQSRYRPTMAYDVSVVLIQATKRTAAALPVQRPVVRVEAIATPVIDAVTPASGEVGTELTITGHALAAPQTVVRVGGVPEAPEAGAVSDTRIVVTLPDGLRAGLHPVQVVHELDLGDPPTPHPGVGVESNVAAFLLLPRITTAPPITVARGDTLALDVEPPVGRAQRVALLLGSLALPVPARPPTAPAESTDVQLEIPDDMPTGAHLARLQVDGAASALEVDTDENSATFRQYIGPVVTVT
jgi:hypothetical protein